MNFSKSYKFKKTLKIIGVFMISIIIIIIMILISIKHEKKKNGNNMEIIEVKCRKCGKEICILKKYVRKEMFCTLGCMNSYYRASNPIPIVNLLEKNHSVLIEA